MLSDALETIEMIQSSLDESLVEILEKSLRLRYPTFSMPQGISDRDLALMFLDYSKGKLHPESKPSSALASAFKVQP